MKLLPIWSIPLMLAVLGIILWVGNLSPLHGVIAASETVLYCVYLVWRSRRRAEAEKPIANILSLFPGHLLVLLAVSLLPDPGWLASLWALVPAASVAYDAVSINAPKGRGRTSTLIGLYAILWAALFTLLDRVIAIRRGFGEQEEIIAAAAFSVFGILFISLGSFRHWRAGKE
jgi:hypothetical protein